MKRVLWRVVAIIWATDCYHFGMAQNSQENTKVCPPGTSPVSVLEDPVIYCLSGRPCSGQYIAEVIANGVGACPANTGCALLPHDPEIMGCVDLNRDDVSYVNPDGTLTKAGQILPGITGSSSPSRSSSGSAPKDKSSGSGSGSGSGRSSSSMSSSGSASGMSKNNSGSLESKAYDPFNPSSKHSGLDSLNIDGSNTSSKDSDGDGWSATTFIIIALVLVLVAVLAGFLLLRRKRRDNEVDDMYYNDDGGGRGAYAEGPETPHNAIHML